MAEALDSSARTKASGHSRLRLHPLPANLWETIDGQRFALSTFLQRCRNASVFPSAIFKV